jgi:murein DD-endopeptidase MepM/ murein hydrolase activator NlpD
LIVGLCLTVAGVTAVPAAFGAGGTNDLERKRDAARRRQGQVKQALNVAQASEVELNRRLEQVGQDLVRKRSEAEAAKADADAANESVTRIATEITALRDRLSYRKQVFNRRAAEAYMGGQGRPLDDLSVTGELFSLPKDFADAARRTELLSHVSKQDGDALGQLSEARSKLSVQELQLVLARDRAKQRAADADAALGQVSGLKVEQEKAQAELRSRISGLQAEADALAAEQAALEKLIKEKLEAAARARAARAAARQRRPGPSPFASRITTGQGISTQGFIWPVQGYVTSGYGRRWGRQHTGIDIAAPAGTPIGAAKAGEVLFAGRMGGYGNLVAVDHGDSVVTLYAHQSRIGAAEGEEVAQGQVIGYVGSTGHSTGNHLHFEVRIDTRPVNPRPYLP